jgi:hypothetical protein
MHMRTTEYNYRPRAGVLIRPPYSYLVATGTVLLLATLLLSSAAHALVLGEASAQSALGSPLRIVIPVTAEHGELLQPDCFRFVSAGGDGSAPIVTARVSLERVTAASRLVVTTTHAVSEPAIRFSILAECDGTTQRAYTVLLDPPESNVPAVATAKQATARESRQERLASQPAAARRSPGPAAPSPTQVVRAPAVVEAALPAPAMPPPPSLRERVAAASVLVSSPFRQVAGTQALPAAAAALPSRVQPAAPSGSSLAYVLAAGLAIAGITALAVLFARRRQAPPAIPQWTRSASFSDTRSSFTDLSAAPVTLPHTLSRAGATTTRGTPATSKAKSGASSRFADSSARSSNPRTAPVDPSTIDTLLDAIDSDFVEEQAVREAFAAARSDVEREMDGNAILQAIEAAERDMQLAPPAPAQSAIERALEDDLLQPHRQS